MVSVTTAGGDFPQPRREPPAVPRFAPAKFEPGGIIEQSCGAAAPHRLTTKYLCTAPSRQLIWWKQAVRVCLSHCFLRSKRELHWRPPQFITGALYRSNAHLQHTRNFAAGISGPGICPAALSVELRQLAPPAGVEPATVGARCNPGLHHAANSSSFPSASLLVTRPRDSFTSAHPECGASFFKDPRRQEIRERSALTVKLHSCLGRTPYSRGPEQAVNFAVPGHKSRGR